jgi:hypothetical protein
MRKTQYLIREARQNTNTTDVEAITDYLAVSLLNRAQEFIQAFLFTQNIEAKIFRKSYVLTTSSGVEEYALPSDVYAKNSINNIMYKNGDTYSPLRQIAEKARGVSTGYFLSDSNIILSPMPSFTQIFNVSYTRRLPSLGISKGTSIAGTANASLVVQDITYTSKIIGLNGNLVSIEYIKGIKAFKIIQDLTYTAASFGVSGDLIRIRYVAGSIAGSEVVTVSGNNITVTIENGVSTASQIESKILLSPAALLLVSVAVTGTGSNSQLKTDPTYLSGGVEFASAGNEVVLVSGYSITVTIEDGVSTATQVAAKLSSSSLVSISISGTPSSTQTTQAQTYLSGGLNSLTIGALPLDELTIVDDYFSTVDSFGDILTYGNVINSYDYTTGVIQFTGGVGIMYAGQFVVPGKYATTLCQLPDELESAMIMSLENSINARLSSKDIQISKTLTDEMLAQIGSMFADNTTDTFMPPMVEYSEWL